jgi:uncharacterized protein YraI
MDDSPRFRFFSLTFLVGFGVGAFVGVAFGLMAFAVVGDGGNEPQAEAQQPTAVVSSQASVTPTPVRARTNVAMDVRIGPGNEYAAVGTINRGEPLDVLGRDNASEWIAVRFPPGSSARGWLPLSAIDNLTNVSALAVALPTPLPRTISTPSFTGVQGGGSGGGTTTNDGPAVVGTPGTPDPNSTPRATGTARPTTPPDLTVTRASRLPDGRVQVVVTNRGASDLVDHQIMVVVADPTTRSETLRAPGTGLRAGQSITLESDTFVVTEPTSVIVTVDPSFSYPDAERGNNTLTAPLAPPVTPTPVPTSSGE